MTNIVDRQTGAAGELVLRRSGPHFEIIANGTFLMDTRNGESERLLVTAAATRMPPGPMLIGGLGVGFSLHAALTHPRTGPITVIEREPAVISWCHGPLRHIHADSLSSPRVTCIQADLLPWLRNPPTRFAAICLDIDNGPNWTVSAANAALYDDTGLVLLARALLPGGVLAVWSASASPAFATRLGTYFPTVETLTVPVPRGEPDVVFVAGGQASTPGAIR